LDGEEMTVRIIIGKRIAITGLEVDEARAWARLARQENPAKVKMERLGKWTGNIASHIELGYVRPTTTGPMVVLPRGMLGQVRETYGDDATWDVRVATIDTRIDVEDTGEPVTLRDYQARALAPWFPETWALPGLPVDGIIHAPTGSGKTEMGVALFQRLRTRTLIILHTKDLQRQWAERFDKYGVACKLVGGIGKAARIVGDEPVTVGMVRSLHNRDEELDSVAGAFGLVIVDEAHRGAGLQTREVVERLRPGARVGLTATPEREDGLGPTLQMVMGPIRSVVSREDLAEANVAVPFTVRRIDTGWEPSEDPGEGFVAAISEMIQDDDRNDLVVTETQALAMVGHSILVLTSRKDHADELARLLDCPALTSDIKDKDRAEVIDTMRRGEVQCATATQLADEGLDIPLLSAIVMATPARAKGRTMQRVGRALRPVEGKPEPVVVDFVDYHGLYISQWRSRLSAYKTAGMTAWGR